MPSEEEQAPLIRAATARDVRDIHALIVELAVATGMPERVRSTPDDFLRHGFGERPEFEVLIAEHRGRSVGLSLYFYEFSTWLGRPGVYVQDLVVIGEYRGSGLAERLMRETARAGRRRGANHLRLSVETGNDIAIRFYRKIGLEHAENERIYTAKDEAFERLAGEP